MKNLFFIITILTFLFILSVDGVDAKDYRVSEVDIFEKQTRKVASFQPFGPGDVSGLSFALFDMNENGDDEILVINGAGRRKNARVFTKNGVYTGKEFFPFVDSFQGETDIAVGNIFDKRRESIVVSQKSFGNGVIEIYNAKTFTKEKHFIPIFDFKGGMSVDTQDIDNDGLDEIVVGIAQNGGPQVLVLDQDGAVMRNFFAFDPGFRGGIDIACGNFLGNAKEDIAVARLSAGTGEVAIFDGESLKKNRSFQTFPESHKGGVNIQAENIDGDANDEIVVSVNSQGGAVSQIYEPNGKRRNIHFQSFESDYRGGISTKYSQKNRSYIVVSLSHSDGVDNEKPQKPDYKYIEIDTYAKRLKYFEAGKKIMDTTVSAGRRGMETPSGKYAIRFKDPMYWSSQYRLWMPKSLNFLGGYFIHALPVWPGGYEEGRDHLGINVSHGCVRVSPEAAAKLFNFVEVGTKVYINS